MFFSSFTFQLLQLPAAEQTLTEVTNDSLHPLQVNIKVSNDKSCSAKGTVHSKMGENVRRKPKKKPKRHYGLCPCISDV